MRRVLVFFVSVAALTVPLSSHVQAGSGCRLDPLANVWGPSRLKVLSPCTTVHGVIKGASKQGDGDYHIGLRLDSGQTIRIEIVPADQPGCTTGAKVRYGVCTGAHIPTPKSGTAVFVTGPKVKDTRTGEIEIHPVWQIRAG